jgi:hypothetical protein
MALCHAANKIERPDRSARPTREYCRATHVLRTIDDLIQEAAELPLPDAAYALWRQKSTIERLEGRTRPLQDRSTPEARDKSDRTFIAQMKYEHDFAQDGPTFGRLKRAHPHVDDAELKAAIVAAVKFDDDCFRFFSRGGDYSEKVKPLRRPRGIIRLT